MTNAELRRQRDTTIAEHIAAECDHDIDRALRTFRTAHYHVYPLALDAPGEGAVRDLLGAVFAAFPDFEFVPARTHHADDTVIVEGAIIGSHLGEWAGIAGTGNRVEVPTCCLYHFDGTDLISETVYFDHATMLAQISPTETRV
ncbi:MAG: ester cyclase [Acidimicrobiia bacterium]